MSKPNILMIVVDDLNSWISCLGDHPDALTPNIDRLADEGILFSQAYCPAPYCNASRMATFTGHAPYRSGIYSNEPYWEKPDRPKTLFEAFRNSGYKLYGAGKVFHGQFDYRTATENSATSASWLKRFHNDQIWDGFLSPSQEPLPVERPLNGMFEYNGQEKIDLWNYNFDWGPLADSAFEQHPDILSAQYISDILHKDHDAPFFCALGLYKPHLPWHAPKKYFDRFRNRPPALPLVKHNDLEDAPPVPVGWVKKRDDHVRILKHDQWHAAVAAYLACVSFCDDNVGIVLNALAASGKADNTIVLFFSDNGFHLGQKLHWRKFVLWEEATRVPMIIKTPRTIKAPGVCNAPASLIDIAPTLFELCEIEAPDCPDGASLANCLSDPAGFSTAKPAISTWHKGNHSIRSGQWRYTRYHDGAEELFNQTLDRFEWRNLANLHNYNGTLETLRKLCPQESP
ncbi:MAG: sulfatase [Pseudomonadota bacterium]